MLVEMRLALLAMLENEGDDARYLQKKYIYRMLVMLDARKIFAPSAVFGVGLGLELRLG